MRMVSDNRQVHVKDTKETCEYSLFPIFKYFVCLFLFFKPKNRCEVREQCDRSGIGGSVSVATGAPWLDRDQICRNPEVSFIFKIQSQLKM